MFNFDDLFTGNQAFEKMKENLYRMPLPATLLKQYVPNMYTLAANISEFTPENILLAKIQNVLDDYADACNMVS